MSICLDTSFLTGLFVEADAFTENARALFVEIDEDFIVSDFAVAEFASAIARLTRTGRLTREEAREIFSGFDSWRARSAEAESVDASDIRTATAVVRRLDLNIRAPDAINLAIARRIGSSIATYDRGMAANARILGIAVAVT
ncbi:MAG: VapC toxin family PIN domain ribonuclease [Acetobacteraceae bacterium]|nr:VapC toxin family PIN domain ribonuclease [Acetobacteraceae bacterium]